MQLNLFEWDLLAVGSGYGSLARLDFGEARRSFARVLQAIPDHGLAARGLRDFQYWHDAFDKMRRLDAASAVRLGWRALGGFDFDKSENQLLLRRNVLLHLLTQLEELPDFYDPPCLCCGWLHLETGNFMEAERQLRLLLKTRPHAGLLHLFLAEALWRRGKKETAGVSYAKALLLDPASCAAQTISNQALALCLERGPDLTPVYGFLAGFLPLVELDSWPETAECRIYLALRNAELAKRNRDHTAMITARAVLKRLSTEIFQDYLSGMED